VYHQLYIKLRLAIARGTSYNTKNEEKEERAFSPVDHPEGGGGIAPPPPTAGHVANNPGRSKMGSMKRLGAIVKDSHV